MTGPLDPCGRNACATESAHPGSAHLDPTHRLYEGPDISLQALPAAVYRPTFVLLHTARRDGWNLPAVNVALHQLATEIHRLNDQVAAVRVDRDRGIRDRSPTPRTASNTAPICAANVTRPTGSPPSPIAWMRNGRCGSPASRRSATP